MPYLTFIDDQKIENIVREVLQKGSNAKKWNEKQFYKNAIDPFSILFEMSGFSIDFDTWFANEKIRQAQKTLSNCVGSFHQNILGSLDGWEQLNVGGIIDVVSHERKIIAEIKNKHNTLKASDQCVMYEKLHDMVMTKGHIYKGYVAYYVEIIPKKAERYDRFFTPPKNLTGSKCHPNPLIRKIDGYSFYTLATGGIDDALYQLFSVLPEVFEKISPDYRILKTDVVKDIFRKTYLDS